VSKFALRLCIVVVALGIIVTSFGSAGSKEYVLMEHPQCPVCLLEADLGGRNVALGLKVRSKLSIPIIWCTRCGNLYSHRGVKVTDVPESPQDRR
jgi:hypothetical protein